jgi:hypothetical protein
MNNKLDEHKNLKYSSKIALSTSSVGVAVGGLVLATVSTGGLALPLIGSALISAGVSSTIHTIQNESINVKSYLSDVGTSALIGVFTGGIGSILGAAATGSILISSSVGAASNLGAKAISELKECTFNNKSWCKFGRNYDNEGKKISGLSAWISTGSVGAITGASGIFNSSIHNVLGRIGVTAVASGMYIMYIRCSLLTYCIIIILSLYLNLSPFIKIISYFYIKNLNFTAGIIINGLRIRII